MCENVHSPTKLLLSAIGYVFDGYASDNGKTPFNQSINLSIYSSALLTVLSLQVIQHMSLRVVKNGCPMNPARHLSMPLKSCMAPGTNQSIPTQIQCALILTLPWTLHRARCFSRPSTCLNRMYTELQALPCRIRQQLALRTRESL